MRENIARVVYMGQHAHLAEGSQNGHPRHGPASEIGCVTSCLHERLGPSLCNNGVENEVKLWR